jgi:hypothetical protein
MTEADKEVQRIIRKYKLTPSKLLFVEDVKQEEINTLFENIKEDLINYIHSCLNVKDKYPYTFEIDISKLKNDKDYSKELENALKSPSKLYFYKDGEYIEIKP